MNSLTPLLRNYPIILKELVAALVAGLILAFTVVALWLVASPSVSLVYVLVAILLSVSLLSYFALRLILYPPRTQARHGLATFGVSHWEDIGFRAGDGV